MIDTFFWLKKGVAFLTDPITSVCLVVLFGLLIRRFLPVRLSRRLLLGLFATFWIFSTPLVGGLLLSPLEPDLGTAIPKEFQDAPVVVLGCGHREVPELALVDQYQECSLRRVVHAVHIHKRTAQPLVFSGGIMPNKKESEASVNQRLAVSLGVDPTSTQVVEGAVDTASESETLREALTEKKLFLVTSASHIVRATEYLERVGFEVEASAADRKVLSSSLDYHQLSLYLPSLNGASKTQRAIYEYLGLLSQSTLE